MNEFVKLSALKNLCCEHRISRFLYLTEEQDNYPTNDPVKWRIAFDTMLVHETPNVVCLKSMDNYMLLHNVKSDVYVENIEGTGTIIKISCDGYRGKNQRKTYTFLAT